MMNEIGLDDDVEYSVDFSGDRAGVVVTKMDVWRSNGDMRGREEGIGGLWMRWGECWRRLPS